MFVRGQVPMTKAEIRTVTLSKARLLDSHVVWDIGAGTGSVSVEAALAASKGEIYAVEKDDEALELIKKNVELFGAANVRLCPGTAPEALAGLPAPDRVFIGGSGGQFKEILEYACAKLPRGGRVVINAVVLETLTAAVEMLRLFHFSDLDITQVSVTKAVDLGRMHMFRSHNPVYIISGEKQ